MKTYPFSYISCLTNFGFLLCSVVTASAQGFLISNGELEIVSQSLNADGAVGRIDTGGQLLTNGDSITSAGEDVEFLNFGAVETLDSYGVSFRSSGNGARVVNAGVGVSDGAFLVSTGNELFLNNSGYLSSRIGQFTAEGFPLSLGHTIRLVGSDSVVINSGEIRALGDSPAGGVFAVLSEGDRSRITNAQEGIIYSIGSGIRSTGLDAEIINDGIIETQASKFDFNGFATAFFAPIDSSGNNARIFNSGELVASGINSDAIVARGLGATIINTGLIRAGSPFDDAGVPLIRTGLPLLGVGDSPIGNGIGILSLGDTATIFNSGTISSVRVGIEASGDNAKINNAGLIQISGFIDQESGSDMHGYGIFSEGKDVEVEHSGVILGNDFATQSFIHPPLPLRAVTHGIALDPDGTADGVANISGKISVTGNAILGGDGEQVVNLRDGAQIVGAIDLGGGVDTVNVETTGASSALTFLNVENILFASQVNGVVVGDTLYTVDPSVFSYQAQTVSSLASRVHGSMLRRAQQPNATGSFWVDASAFGFDSEGSRKMRGYEHDAYIFSLGYEFDLGSGKAGLLAGYSEGYVEGDGVSFEDDVSSIVIGGYFRLPLDSINLTTSVLIGNEEHVQKRFILDNMSGMQSVEAEIDGYFVSPSVSVDAAFQLIDNVYLVPSSRLSYTLAYFEDYSETGTGVGEYTVDDRYLHILNLQAEVAGVYEFGRGACALVVGADSRYSDESSIEAAIAGQTLRISPVNDGSVVAGLLAARASIRILDNLSIAGDIESRFSDDEDEIFGRLQLSGRF